MVTVSAFDPATGRLTERQRLSALPTGYQGSAAAGEIVLSKDGRNLYASNRFYNSIAHFHVGADGLLTYGSDTITAPQHAAHAGHRSQQTLAAGGRAEQRHHRELSHRHGRHAAASQNRRRTDAGLAGIRERLTHKKRARGILRTG